MALFVRFLYCRSSLILKRVQPGTPNGFLFDLPSPGQYSALNTTMTLPGSVRREEDCACHDLGGVSPSSVGLRQLFLRRPYIRSAVTESLTLPYSVMGQLQLLS